MDEPKRRRRKNLNEPKVNKNIVLTAETVEKIVRFSAENPTSFSANLEDLALLGLENEVLICTLNTIMGTLQQAVNSSMNRLGKLAASSAIESGVAKELSNILLLQLMLSQHSRYGDELEDRIRVKKGHPAQQLQGEFLGISKARIGRRLRSSLVEVEEILRAEDIIIDEFEELPDEYEMDAEKLKKHVSLTPQGVAKIGEFSADHKISFSAAIECLALVGLKNELSVAILPIINSSLYKLINHRFNRVAKLGAVAAIDAGIARESLSALLLQLMINKHERYGDDIDAFVQVEKGHVARKLQGKILGIGRKRAVQRLKTPLKELDAILGGGG